MSITIREAGINDAVLIADISHQTFYETFAASNRPEDMDKFLSHQFTKGKLMLEVGKPENQFFLAYLGEELAGYVKLRNGSVPISLGHTDALEIARLYALHDFIGKGIGSALMEFSINKASAMGKTAVWLGVWEENTRAIEFYHRWGFEKFAETDFLLGDDVQLDWLMRKSIRNK